MKYCVKILVVAQSLLKALSCYWMNLCQLLKGSELNAA